MLLIMKHSATEAEIKNVVQFVENAGLRTHLSTGESLTFIGAIGDKQKLLAKNPQLLPGVERIVQISESYKLANLKFHPDPTVVSVGNVKIGGGHFAILAGPCAIESRDQLFETAHAVISGGAQILRGGAFKPRSSPYSFQGLEVEGLKYMAEVREKTGIPVVTEVTSERAVEAAIPYVDMLQIGARNMQNFELLKAVGKTKLPVFLKRGLSATIDEWLNAAEYVMSAGNESVVLCERGIRTFETATRNTLDLSCIPVLRERTHLPIVIDPSHATGHRELVAPMAKAAAAAGADGLMIEVHPNPAIALSDGPQSLNPEDFATLVKELRPFIELAGRRLGE